MDDGIGITTICNTLDEELERPVYNCNEYTECGCGNGEHCMYCLKSKEEHESKGDTNGA